MQASHFPKIKRSGDLMARIRWCQPSAKKVIDQTKCWQMMAVLQQPSSLEVVYYVTMAEWTRPRSSASWSWNLDVIFWNSCTMLVGIRSNSYSRGLLPVRKVIEIGWSKMIRWSNLSAHRLGGRPAESSAWQYISSRFEQFFSGYGWMFNWIWVCPI